MAEFKLTPVLLTQITGLLRDGATNKDVIELVGVDTKTFYNWIRWGRALSEGLRLPDQPKAANDPILLQFFQGVTRAAAESRELAIKAFRSGLQTAEETRTLIETFTETRLDRKGVPYDYVRTVERTEIIVRPPDWRAGAEWLARRDKSNWSNRQEIVNIDSDRIAIQMIAAGEISFEMLADELKDEAEARRLFLAAGQPIDG